MLKLLQFINRIKFRQNRLRNIFGGLTPKGDVADRIRTKVTIEMVLFDSGAIALPLLSLNLQKLLSLLIPAVDLYLLLLAKINESADLKHVILGLQTVCDNVSAKRDEFDSFEFSAYLPADVINTELQSLRTVQQEQHS